MTDVRHLLTMDFSADVIHDDSDETNECYYMQKQQTILKRLPQAARP